jgi:hypothetical protein
MPGMTTAIGETGDLSKAWGAVAKNAESARVAIGQASTAATRSVPAAIASGGGGGRHRPGWLGGGPHIGGPGVPIPGGSHVNFRGGAAAAAGLIG